MEAPDFTSSYGLAVLLDDIKVEPPEAILRRLYGPLYRDGFIDRTSYGGFDARSTPHYRFVARRHPKPLNAAGFLTPIVLGEIAHDGSSRNRHSRTSGWWRVNEDRWGPTSLTEIVVALQPAAERLLDAAVDRSRSERVIGGREAEVAAMLPAAFDSLYALVGSGATRFAETAGVWREDPRFALPAGGQDSALVAWLTAAAAANGWSPGSRVAALDVWAAYRATGGQFLQFDLLRRLDAALGPEGARTRRGFRIPDRNGSSCD